MFWKNLVSESPNHAYFLGTVENQKGFWNSIMDFWNNPLYRMCLRHWPEATVNLVWKTHLEMRHFKMVYYVMPYFHFPELWIKLIYDKITQIYCIKNEFNLACLVQNIGKRTYQNSHFETSSFQTGIFKMGLQLPLSQITKGLSKS